MAEGASITPISSKRKQHHLVDVGISPGSNARVRKLNVKDCSQESNRRNLGHFQVECNPHVKKVYQIIKKHTGSLGGNGYFGAVYGEATMGGMQRIVNLMKEHCNFDESSSFIDVGSGLGKPNFHVAHDPGVKISFGIELEKVRHNLAINNLHYVMQYTKISTPQNHGHVFLKHGDILEASSFDPFTHVYIFDIGFPPPTLHRIAQIFNGSQSPYLICYHSPRLTVDTYGFNVELITQYKVSLHGSGESHTGYIYKHVGKSLQNFDESIVAPFFQEGVEMILAGDESRISNYVEIERHAHFEGTRPRRSCRKSYSHPC